VRQDLEGTFRKSAPTRANIRFPVIKFKRTGSLFDEKRPGRPKTSEDDAVEQSSRASIRRLSNQLDIPRTTAGEFCILKLRHERIVFKCVTTTITFFGTHA
jgi:hypothetical protein